MQARRKAFAFIKSAMMGGLVRFADSPINQFLWNEDCNELNDFSKIVDLNHYYQLVIKKLERWLA